MIQSIERAFQILRVAYQQRNGVAIGEIAKETGLHTSTVSRIVSTLEALNALERIDGRLFIGEEIIELAGNAPLTERLISAATTALRDLATETQEAVGLTLIEGDECHVFYQIPSSHHIQIRDWTGERFPLHVTSTGKVYFAHLTQEELADFANTDFSNIAPATKTDWAELEDELDQIRVDGVAWTIDELEEGLTSVAAPIYDERGNFVAGLYVSIPNYRVTERDVLAQQVRNAASTIVLT